MATQFVSTSHPLSSSAAAPALAAGMMTHPVPTSPIMRPRKRGEEKPIQDREKLVVEMLPLVKRRGSENSQTPACPGGNG